MCPNCIRGIKDGVVCEQCAGTGFWNPQSLSANAVQAMQDEQATVDSAPQDGSSVGVETATVETQDTSSNQAPADQGVQASPEVVLPSAEDQVNG